MIAYYSIWRDTVNRERIKMNNKEEPELLTIPEAAQLLRIQPTTVRSWVLHRRVPFVKLGRVVRIRKMDCLTLINQCIVPAQPKAA